jgi:hypothetical protein
MPTGRAPSMSASPATWCGCSRNARRRAMSSAPTCGCAPTRRPRRSPSRSRPPSPTTRAWARTGNARHDQGAPGGRRPRARREPSCARSAPSSGAGTSISRPSPTSIPSSARSTRTRGRRGRMPPVQVEGHDVKLGRGGIREIEFTAQVLQLIWGGRDPGLRDPTTLGALAALAAAGKIERRAAADLADAYVFLRNLEHRLQMVADRQTHRCRRMRKGSRASPPSSASPTPRPSAAAFTGHCSASSAITAVRGRADARRGGGEGAAWSSPAWRTTRRRSRRSRPWATQTRRPSPRMVRGWHHGHTRATRSERARELLTALMPALLAAFAKQRRPDAGADAARWRLRAAAAGCRC